MSASRASREHIGAFAEGQAAVLESITRDDPLAVTLAAIVELVEGQPSEMLCSVLLLDRRTSTLHDGAGPSLPEAYRRAIDGIPIGPSVGSCGSAAALGQVVEVTDIATDPRWVAFRDLALPHGLRACWSSPIVSATKEVLGTFAMYYREPRGPTPAERAWVATATHLAAVAIERDRSRDALAASDARYRLLVDTASEGVWVADNEGRTTFVNKRMADLLGTTPEDVIGRPSTDFVAPVSLAAVATARGERREGRPGQSEVALRRRDGAVVWVQANAVPIRGPSGEVTGSFAMISDVTERRRVEAALRMSEAELRATFDHAGLGLALVGPDFRARRVNAGLARFLGYTVDELLAMQIGDTAPDPEARAATATEYRELLAGERTALQHERLLVRKDGARVWGRVTATLVDRGEAARPDAPGREPLVLIMVEDIDARKKLEAQALRAQRLDALARLAGGVAHDFNNLLTAIDGFAHVALDELPAGAPAAAAVTEITRAAARATDLVRRILTFSRDLEPQRVRQRLGPVVAEVASLLRQSLPPSIALALELDEDAPLVKADAAHVHQIVMNLATNAIQAMPDGGVLTLRLGGATTAEAIAPDIGPGVWARLAVTDTGVGIDAATLERLFEPFFTTRPPGQGAGLGLSMVHGIARSHGGGVVVRSEPGHGSTFEVWLPAAPEPTTAPRAAARVGPPGRGERVLLVDDEPAIVRLAARTLTRAGYDVRPFGDPTQALAAFRAAPDAFDVIVSDISMPHLTGFELARAIRAERPATPILLVSGGPWSRDHEDLKRLGIADILQKPGALKDLAEAVRRALPTPAR